MKNDLHIFSNTKNDFARKAIITIPSPSLSKVSKPLEALE